MTTNPISEADVWEALRTVIDPELGCNIVDLGLIYDIAILGTRVRVTMTLTTPGCPMHESLCGGVQIALLNLHGVDDADVELVWDPPWHPSMMTDAGRAQTGVRVGYKSPAHRPPGRRPPGKSFTRPDSSEAAHSTSQVKVP